MFKILNIKIFSHSDVQNEVFQLMFLTLCIFRGLMAKGELWYVMCTCTEANLGSRRRTVKERAKIKRNIVKQLEIKEKYQGQKDIPVLPMI